MIRDSGNRIHARAAGCANVRRRGRRRSGAPRPAGLRRPSSGAGTASSVSSHDRAHRRPHGSGHVRTPCCGPCAGRFCAGRGRAWRAGASATGHRWDRRIAARASRLEGPVRLDYADLRETSCSCGAAASGPKGGVRIWSCCGTRWSSGAIYERELAELATALSPVLDAYAVGSSSVGSSAKSPGTRP